MKNSAYELHVERNKVIILNPKPKIISTVLLCQEIRPFYAETLQRCPIKPGINIGKFCQQTFPNKVQYVVSLAGLSQQYRLIPVLPSVVGQQTYVISEKLSPPSLSDWCRSAILLNPRLSKLKNLPLPTKLIIELEATPQSLLNTNLGCGDPTLQVLAPCKGCKAELRRTGIVPAH